MWWIEVLEFFFDVHHSTLRKPPYSVDYNFPFYNYAVRHIFQLRNQLDQPNLKLGFSNLNRLSLNTDSIKNWSSRLSRLIKRCSKVNQDSSDLFSCLTLTTQTRYTSRNLPTRNLTRCIQFQCKSQFRHKRYHIWFYKSRCTWCWSHDFFFLGRNGLPGKSLYTWVDWSIFLLAW